MKSSGNFFPFFSALMSSEARREQALRTLSSRSPRFGGSVIEVRLVQPHANSSGKFFTFFNALMSSETRLEQPLRALS